MRKLITGLLAILTIVFAMSPSASAQEAPAEDPTEQFPVDCTLRNFTDPSFSNEDGTYPAGTPISLELYVPNGGPMEFYFVASRDDSEAYRLNDESMTVIGWTPIDTGTYTVRGEFIDENGNVLPVEDPARCTHTLTVVTAAPAEPEPEPAVPTTTPTTEPSDDDVPLCGPAETLTLVDVGNGYFDVYNAEGELCSQIGGVQTPATVTPVIARSTELPQTGSATTALAIAGVSLVFFGLVLKRFGKLRLDA